MNNRERLTAIRQQAKKITQSSSFVEFRQSEELSVGVAVNGLRSNNLGITVRENEPLTNPKGEELFQYKGLVVVYRMIGTPRVKEVRGAQIRNEKGVLVEWTSALGIPDREKIKGNKTKMIQPEIDYTRYEDYLKSIDVTRRHDKYGRTNQEQERENEVAAAFGIETYRLMYHSQTDPGDFDLPIVQSPAFPRNRSVYYNLPSGRICIGEFNNALGGLKRTEVHVTPWSDSPAELYHVRQQDKRLGVQFYDGNRVTPSNPAGAKKGEELIHLLKSLS